MLVASKSRGIFVESGESARMEKQHRRADPPHLLIVKTSSTTNWDGEIRCPLAEACHLTGT